MWIIYLVALIALSSDCTVNAFPQNSLQEDRLVFDGPVQQKISTPPPSSNMAPGTPLKDLQYDTCLANCLTTPEYNPICGSDNVSYENPGQLNCATLCGKAVTLSYYGRCALGKLRGR